MYSVAVMLLATFKPHCITSQINKLGYCFKSVNLLPQ